MLRLHQEKLAEFARNRNLNLEASPEKARQFEIQISTISSELKELRKQQTALIQTVRAEEAQRKATKTQNTKKKIVETDQDGSLLSLRIHTSELESICGAIQNKQNELQLKQKELSDFRAAVQRWTENTDALEYIMSSLQLLTDNDVLSQRLFETKLNEPEKRQRLSSQLDALLLTFKKTFGGDCCVKEQNALDSLHKNKRSEKDETEENTQQDESSKGCAYSKCSDCGSLELVITPEGIVCTSCAIVQQDRISNVLSFAEKTHAHIQKTDTYRRINHFRECLRQAQGKSRARIPPAVYAALEEEIVKYQHHFTRHEISPQFVKAALKKRRLSKYYEHIAAITSALNPSYTPLNIEPEHENSLCLYFKQTELPYINMMHSVNKDRKNFMSYPFLAYKICELFGWTQYMKHFELLKSITLCGQQDRWWWCVCLQLNWPPIATVGNFYKFKTQGLPSCIRVIRAPDSLQSDSLEQVTCGQTTLPIYQRKRKEEGITRLRYGKKMTGHVIPQPSMCAVQDKLVDQHELEEEDQDADACLGEEDDVVDYE